MHAQMVSLNKITVDLNNENYNLMKRKNERDQKIHEDILNVEAIIGTDWLLIFLTSDLFKYIRAIIFEFEIDKYYQDFKKSLTNNHKKILRKEKKIFEKS